jgi:hypothetical protein
MHFSFDNLKILLFGNDGLHSLAVKFAIRLRSWPSHRWPLAPIQETELDSSCIGNPPHEAIQGIDFAHQLSLADPADCGIAGHYADRIAPHCDKRCPCAGPSSRRRCLTTGVASTNHNDIEFMNHLALSNIRSR